MAAGIDQIFVKMSAGFNEISASEWFGMALSERMDLLSSSGVKFMRGGEVVAAREALGILKEMKAAA